MSTTIHPHSETEGSARTAAWSHSPPNPGSDSDDVSNASCSNGGGRRKRPWEADEADTAVAGLGDGRRRRQQQHHHHHQQQQQQQHLRPPAASLSHLQLHWPMPARAEAGAEPPPAANTAAAAARQLAMWRCLSNPDTAAQQQQHQHQRHRQPPPPLPPPPLPPPQSAAVPSTVAGWMAGGLPIAQQLSTSALPTPMWAGAYGPPLAWPPVAPVIPPSWPLKDACIEAMAAAQEAICRGIGLLAGLRRLDRGRTESFM
jgi:hypothetical protein